MAITSRKLVYSVLSKTADDFIGGAPDTQALASATPVKTIRKSGNKSIITVSIAPVMLAKVAHGLMAEV